MDILTGADILVQRLKAHGVRHIFGYPGGQLMPIYDALRRDGGIRHILARDEQAAAFMADGYARTTGRPGVCLGVCGPGAYNAITPLASAFTDSVPVLLISGQIVSKGARLRSGYYHENEQRDACRTICKKCTRAASVETIATEVDEVFSNMVSGRPGTALLEIPLDVQRAELNTVTSPPPPRSAPVEPKPREVDELAGLISRWKKPLLMAGGGVVSSGAEKAFTALTDRLSAPVFHSLMGKCAISSEHRLKAGLPWCRGTSDASGMEQFFSPLFQEADGILAIGCRFSQVTTGSWGLKLPGSLAQIDVDDEEIGRHYPVELGICADAKASLESLLKSLSEKPRSPWSLPRPQSEHWRLPGIDLLGSLRKALPRDGIIAADATRLSYILLAEFPMYETRTFLHPAGFIPMGFGIPAALGAKAALPDRTVVAVVGDGCFMMSGMELATAVQEKLPIIVVLVNDHSLSLIKAIQERRYEGRYLGVDLYNPDFQLFAKAFGVRSWAVSNDAEFGRALSEAIASEKPALIEVKLPARTE